MTLYDCYDPVRQLSDMLDGLCVQHICAISNENCGEEIVLPLSRLPLSVVSLCLRIEQYLVIIPYVQSGVS